MARKKPITEEDFLHVKGVGEKKCKQYSQKILEAIKQYCIEANS
jgi:ATP-dependent DNA helicase RecQ